MPGWWSDKKKAPDKPKPADPGSSIYLGRYLDLATRATGSELTYDGERHLLLFGPNGSGKGTRILVPNLLRINDRSIVVIDPKGELTAITAAYRKKVSDVVILNPFDVLGLGGAGFNPLAALDPDAPTFVDDASGIGEALIKIDDGKEPHWSESAQGLLVALIMWEVKCAKRANRPPSLENVRRLLTEAPEYEDVEGGGRRANKGLRATVREMCLDGGFEIESLAARFLRDSDEIASIQSTADRQTSWMLSPLMRANMAKNDIDFAALKERPITVYLILPAERMRTHSVWLRLVIVSALRALYRPGGLRTLFMLDEFAQLGHLAPVEDAFGLVRGYGVQLWPVLQDLNQLKALYKDRWETFVGNAGIVQGFAPNDLTTAEWMSRRAGETTVTAASFNQGDATSSAGHGSMSQSSGLGYSQARRPLFLPQELMDFPPGSGLLWPAGTSKSVPFSAPSYWSVSELNSRAQRNPYYDRREAARPAALAKKPMLTMEQQRQLAETAQKMRAEATRFARWVRAEVIPPTMRALRIAANEIARLTIRAANFVVRETPPLMRRLKAFSLEAMRVTRKGAETSLIKYHQMREARKIAATKKLGPPIEAGRDIHDGAE